MTRIDILITALLVVIFGGVLGWAFVPMGEATDIEYSLAAYDAKDFAHPGLATTAQNALADGYLSEREYRRLAALDDTVHDAEHAVEKDAIIREWKR